MNKIPKLDPLLLKIKTPLQFGGVVVWVVGIGLLLHASIVTGCLGIVFGMFALTLAHLEHIQPNQRALLVIALATVLCAFLLLTIRSASSPR
jgi:hypothetical protein